ncbi:hypothetical protein E5288_WYG004297 [Bos mutus]|uniref:Uncharacterized protein n=1 Tax=Bos mutus TaxID=72004 RepID=A0A6B0R472_9CETA|nr:hypothetical protein [Bos mutus]
MPAFQNRRLKSKILSYSIPPWKGLQFGVSCGIFADKKDGDDKDRYDLNDATESVSLGINPVGGDDAYRMR